jgi:hypothetical protein
MNGTRSAFAYSASCVLRRPEDCLVRRLPSKRELRRVRNKIPGTEVVLAAEPGDRLSDLLQDSYSFRYGWINLGATSRAGLRRRYRRALRMLKFDFEPLQNGIELDLRKLKNGHRGSRSKAG